MENKRFIGRVNIFTLLMFLALVLPLTSFAYEVPVHRALTKAIINSYEGIFNQSFSRGEKDYILKGSEKEDNLPRPANHFYDPINNRGLNIGLLEWSSSKKWAEDTVAQSKVGDNIKFNDKYFSDPDDFSWERAIFEYVHGDKNRGLETLGHILHLIEDTTVPAHMRNDQHLNINGRGFADSYEIFTKDFRIKDIKNNNINIKNIYLYNSLGQYFDKSALFTNNNFLSDDTIFKDYLKPSINKLTESVDSNGYKFLSKKYNDETIKVVYVKEDKTTSGDWQKYVNKTKKQYLIESPSDIILTDYWNTLSREAVKNGVGVVDLFFKAVEKEKKSLALLQKNKSQAELAFAKFRPIGFGLVKDIYGSSLSNKDVAELLGENKISQPASVVLSKPKPKAPIKKKILPKIKPIPVSVVKPTIKQKPIVLEPKTISLKKSKLPKKAVITPTTPTPQVPKSILPSPGFGGGGGGAPAATPPPAIIIPVAIPQDTAAPDAPVITSPNNFSQIFTNQDIIFSGTAEPLSTISSDFSQATTSAGEASTQGVWSLSLILPQATSTISFLAEDASGNKSPAATTTLFVDSISPSVSLSSTECAETFSSTNCLVATSTLNFSWSSGSADSSYFTLNQNGAFSTTTATSTVITTSSSNYTFGVSAYDLAGNSSATTTLNIEISQRPVVINEVAWAGTDASATDEWIELYNTSSQDIDLSNWVLRADDGVPYLPLSGIVKAGEYYLIERTDDNTVSDRTADLVVPFSGLGAGSGLEDAGEILFLDFVSNGATTTIDQTPNTPYWQAGNSSTKTTMERVDALVSGAIESNWRDSIALLGSGKDANGAKLKGTPRVENSSPHAVVPVYLLSDIILTKKNSPYLIDSTIGYISNGATITIEPGVVVKFTPRSRMYIQDANIIAEGTAEEPIIFTSFYDDTYGGDFNNDGFCDVNNASSTAKCPASGDWEGVDLVPQTQVATSSFKHTIFRYGGADSARGGLLYLEGVSPQIENSIFEYSLQAGLVLVNSDSVISNNIFRYNQSGFLGGAGSTFTLNGNNFYNNTIGVQTGQSFGIIKDNIFNDNTDAFFYNGPLAGSVSGNSGSGNTNGDYIRLAGDITNIFYTPSTLKINPLPYYIYGTSNVQASTTLNIEDGVTILTWAGYGGSKLNVWGNLNAVGNIIFKDISNATSTGMWQGINMLAGSVGNFDGVTIKNADVAIKYTNSPVNLNNVIFENNNLGIWADTDSINNYPVNASGVSFVGDGATTSPSRLW